MIWGRHMAKHKCSIADRPLTRRFCLGTSNSTSCCAWRLQASKMLWVTEATHL